MQIIPMPNIKSVSAEYSYHDSTKAHFASVPLLDVQCYPLNDVIDSVFMSRSYQKIKFWSLFWPQDLLEGQCDKALII